MPKGIDIIGSIALGTAVAVTVLAVTSNRTPETPSQTPKVPARFSAEQTDTLPFVGRVTVVKDQKTGREFMCIPSTGIVEIGG